jgi:neutral ceramidase
MPDDCSQNTTFNIGAGIYDITGPAAELGMMGYARVDQLTSGIHTRLWSRAFVIESPCNGKRVVFVSADLGMIFQAVKLEVVRRLQDAFPDAYSDENVLLSATHTHSGPGGHSHYTLYNLSTFGFNRQNFEVIVAGIFCSIPRAQANLKPGRILIASGALDDTGINRSPSAYLRNPQPERAVYTADTDKLMTVLKLVEEDGQEIGCINWFAVHGTSMGNHNHLISGDNKGYAAYLFESLKQADPRKERTFVAAFAQSNEGDVSPNIHGGEDGGGADDFESTSISGSKQFRRAIQLYDQATESLIGPVDYRHRYVDMSRLSVAEAWSGEPGSHTCPAAIGESMLAGAEDGPGVGKEGVDCGDLSKLWKFVLCEPESESCQNPKPIVIRSNWTDPPLSPEVLPLQLVRIGDLVLVALPFEATTMAGRRLRNTVEQRLKDVGVKHVVIAGLANAYSGYLVTQEEYQDQQYEGASTHFGPWTLAACQQEFDGLSAALVAGDDVGPGSTPRRVDPKPRDLRSKVFGLLPGVLFDLAPPFKAYGSVKEQPGAAYSQDDTVRVRFWGGHPKNGLLTQSSFLEIQRAAGQSWQPVAFDRDPETKFIWKRILPSFSVITAEWHIPPGTPPGSYRIVVRGHWKPILRGVQPYTGTSQTFTVS